MANKNTMPKLKPCPFCGGKAAQFDGVDRENKKSSSVICLYCGCKIFRADSLRDDAIKTWNTRAKDPDDIVISRRELESNNHHIKWIRDRLVNVYGENEDVDFVKRLDKILEMGNE
jgi:Lar family restriction alleviation protein